MKKVELKVRIPTPCHEDWNVMTPTQKGKFCGVCTKEVIDFTSESDEVIVNHLQKNNNACGRFNASQLDRKLIVNRKKRNHWLSYAASFLLPMTLLSQEAKKAIKNTPKTIQTNTSVYTSLNIGSLHKQEKVAPKIQTDSLTVSGIVTDDSGLPLPGATITVKNTNKGVTTDFDGNYKINMKRNDILVISYVGYDSIEIKVTKNIHDVQLEAGILGDIVVVGGWTTSVPWIDYTERPLTKEQKENKLRIQNYFAFQKKKWQEKREKRRAERAARKAKKAAKRAENKKSSAKQ